MKIKSIISILLVIACILALGACGNQGGDTQTTTTTTASPFDQPEQVGVTVEGKSVFNKIDYTVYIPSSYDASKKTPLVMALHGGLQGTGAMNAPRTVFADFIGLNQYADEYGFIAVYPRQSTENHPFGFDYWNWYSQQSRTDSEPTALYGIICEVKGEYNIDESNVFICGFSAGAAMAEVVAVTYPEVFSGCAIIAGLSYKASQANDYADVQAQGPKKTNDELAQEIVTGMNEGKRVSKLLVINGSADVMVNPVNSSAAANAWATAMTKIDSNVKSGSSSTTASGINGIEYTKTVYATLNDEEISTHYEVSTMGHLWPGANVGVSTDPFFGSDFAFVGGVDASALICEYFGLKK